MHIKEIAMEKYGQIPNSLKDVLNGFDNGKEMFFTGLESCLKRRKNTPFRRYVDIGRVVFGFFEEVYNFQSELSSKEKMKILLRKGFDESFWMVFLSSILKKYHSYYEPCQCKARKDNYYKEYEKMFNLSQEMGGFQKMSHHFIRKVQKKYHPFMTENLNNFFQKKELKMDNLLFPFLVLESIIHGIDDYVDTNRRSRREYTNDIFNVVLGLFGLILYTLREVKVEKADMIRISHGGKSRLEQLVDSLLLSLIDLSQVPMIEKETIGILEYGKRDELNTAKKNMKWRASGINVFLVFASITLGKEKDDNYKLLCDLIKDYRILELLEKDFKDISKDLRNGDYTPVSVWWKKYGGCNDFKNVVKLLTDIYYIDSEILFKKIKKYPGIKSSVMNNIEEKYEKINDFLNSAIKS